MNRHVEMMVRYNAWRRGDIQDMPASAQEIGQAIDEVIGQHEQLLLSLQRLENLCGFPLRRDDPAREASRNLIAKAKGEQE